MAIYYKHKDTGELYEKRGYSNGNNFIELILYPFNKKLYPITITTEHVVDTDSIYNEKGICQEYQDARKMNDDAALEHVLKTFEEIELNTKIELKDTIIPGVYEMIYICPLCGSKMKQEGGAYLTSPLKYDNFCTKDGCGFQVCTSRWHSGSLVCGTDKKEVEKIITTGTFDEKEELDEYSRKMLRHTKNTEDVTKSANLCYQQYCDTHKPNIPKYEDFIAGFGMACLKYKNK